MSETLQMPALGDGRLRGERIKEPEITGKQPKKRSFTQTEPAVKDVEQEPDFNSEGFETSSSRKRPFGEANQKNTSLESTGTSASIPRTDSPGADGCEPSGGLGLHGKVPRVSSQSSCPWSKPSGSSELRRGLRWISERHVSRRQRHQRSQQVIRSGIGCQPRLFPETVFTQKSSMSSRLVKARSRKTLVLLCHGHWSLCWL